MRFRQIDRITHLVPGERIEAQKTLTGREDYLRDHFPRFAVQPGVLMLESLFQAAQFLVRSSEGFQSALVLLREAKGVKFASFLLPGDTLFVQAEIIKQTGNLTLLKASGKNSSGDVCVAGRLVVECDGQGSKDFADSYTGRYMKQLVEQLQKAAVGKPNQGYNLDPSTMSVSSGE
jgi:3-hydroxyacyl-[acyl-carrier-protein] dehydratase